MKLIKILLLWLVVGLPAYAQAVNVTANRIKGSSAAPPATCSAQFTYLQPDGDLYVCANGVPAIVGGGAAANVTVGTSVITGGNTGRVLYNNAGVLGEYTITGTAGSVVMSAGPTLTGAPIISGTTPSLAFTDTTGSAKSLTIAVDANVADLRESAGASGSLLTLDLTNNRVGIVTAAPRAALDVAGDIYQGWAGPNFVGTVFQTGADYKLGMQTNGFTRKVEFYNKGNGESLTGIAFDFLTNDGASPASVGRILRDGTFIIGGTNSATPSNRIISTQSARGGTDTNVAGANLTIQAGIGTGTATPASLLLQSTIKAASGTTAQTVTTGLEIVNGTMRLSNYTVATLPDPAVSGVGAMAFVTDESVFTAITGLGLTPTGGGSNKVPVYSDGAAWRIL